MQCSWCDREIEEKPTQDRATLVESLCLDCAHVKWKRITPLAVWIEQLAYDLGVLREEDDDKRCLHKTDIPGPTK